MKCNVLLKILRVISISCVTWLTTFILLSAPVEVSHAVEPELVDLFWFMISDACKCGAVLITLTSLTLWSLSMGAVWVCGKKLWNRWTCLPATAVATFIIGHPLREVVQEVVETWHLQFRWVRVFNLSFCSVAVVFFLALLCRVKRGVM